MKFSIRADASARIGTGHVMRTLSLADSLADRGAEVQFVSRALEGGIESVVRERGYHVHLLHGIDLDQTTDAHETARAAGPADWHIVDSYLLGEPWERAVLTAGPRIVAIDDLADRRHCVNVLVDPTFPGDPARYSGLADGRLLLGTRYALLSPEYRRIRRPRTAPGAASRPRLLLFMGGTDEPSMSMLVLDVLGRHEFGHIDVDLVIGGANPRSEALKKMCAEHAHWTAYPVQSSLAPLLAAADIAITAGGVTLLERACAGVPGAVITVAENQLPSTEALTEAGITYFAGTSTTVDNEAIAATLRNLLTDAQASERMSLLGMLAVDGHGAGRVAELLEPTGTDRHVMRQATPYDALLYYDWANDAEVRAQSTDSRTIEWASHLDWFLRRLSDARSHLFVLEAHGLPLAQVRFELEGEAYILGYSVDSQYRGRGLGTEVVARGLELLPESGNQTVWASVKPSNPASIRSLMKAGFTLDSSRESDQDLLWLSRKRHH